MRSLWIGTLAAALSCTAPGWSQMLQPDRWIMVREEGKPAVKCRVVSTTKQKDGSTLCQAKTEAGETITLLEEPVKGTTVGKMRMRVLPNSSCCTTCGPLPGVPQPPPPPTGPTPTGIPPTLKPVPPPTIEQAFVQPKPEPPKEKTSLFGRLFQSSPKPEPAKTPAKIEVEKKDAVVKAAPQPAAPATDDPKKDNPSVIGRFFLSTPKPDPAKVADKKDAVVKAAPPVPVLEVRPQLPVSTTSTDDPLSHPDLYTKSGVPGSMPKEPTMPVGVTPTVMAVPPVPLVPTPAPAKPPTLIGRVFSRSETPIVPASVQTKVEPVPAPTVGKPPVEGSESQPGFLAWMQSSPPPKMTVVQEPKVVAPSLLDRLRGQVAAAPTAPKPKPAAIPTDPQRMLPTGMGSIVAARDRGVLGQSAGGAMVRTPSGAMAYLSPEQAPQGSNVVPVSASNAFSLSMPGARPGLNGSMPMVAMQAPANYQAGVPAGAANAFTMTSSARPIPADFGPPPQYRNAFLIDGMGGAYTRPMALAYDPRMGYVPVGGGYPQQMPMLPMPHPAGQMLAILRGSIMPSERERAVLMLSQYNWHAEPEAVAAIMVAAKSDPAPMVRVSCVRALARMKVNTMPAYETLMELKTDKDIRVRQEVEQTLAIMTRH